MELMNNTTTIEKHLVQMQSDLLAIQAGIQADLDSMSELSQMVSMRLQMAMDRRSKFVETLSNVLKTISDTQDSIIQNMK